MQRLFSTFANGWPGAGLLLQRVATGTVLVHRGATQLLEPSHATPDPSQIIAGCAGIFLFVGLWTPVAGTVVAAAETWAILTGTSEPWLSTVLATLGASLAMIGPGASSIDARMFGRRRIDTADS